MRKIHRLDLDFAKDIRTQRKITFKEQDSITLYISIYNFYIAHGFLYKGVIGTGTLFVANQWYLTL